MIDRKQAIRDYKETPRPMGVFRVRNDRAAKSYIGTATDLHSMLNRQRAQLNLNAHPGKELQADWNALGADAFTFDVLDELKPTKETREDSAEELQLLEKMWREKLEAAGEALYPPKHR